MKLFLIFLAFLPVVYVSAQHDPVAAKSAVVQQGNCRFTVLTPQLIRMEWSKDKTFEDHASQVFVNRKLPVPSYTHQVINNLLIIRTTELILNYKISSSPFTKDNLTISSLTSGFTWYPFLADTGNLKGTMRTLDGKDGGDISMLENGIVSKSGWTLIDDSGSYVFDKSNWITDRKDSTAQDLYFFGYGNNYKKALHDFTLVSGKIPMPPRFAFGYWWSRYWIYGEQEMKDLVQSFKKLDIPIDVMIIDMDWHYTYGFRGNATVDDTQGSIVGWTGYTWNKNIFPQPKKFVKWMEDQNIKNALNLHPAAGIPPMEEKYGAFAKAYNFDTSSKNYIPYYGSDKKWSSIYFDSVLRPLEKDGVDFWWLDWQQYPYDRLKKKLSNTWWLNHVFFTDMQKQGKRPLLFHRWGGLGNHRYQVGFSGDTYTTWKSLAFQPEFTSTASNVGYGYWSHDIGGHQISSSHPADIKDGELFLRWMQFGVFSPVLRTHSTKRAEIDRRFWNFKEEYQDIVNLVKLRYQLNPYIYSASRNAFDKGVSLCYPLYYNDPSVPEAYQFNDQYYFGDQMILAPVVSKTDSNKYLAHKRIWLPEGEWEEWATGISLKGNKTYDRKFSKTEIPAYVKAGSIIPMYSDNIKNLQKLSDTIILHIFRGNGSGRLYEDDGETEEYIKGKYRETKFDQSYENQNQVIRINAANGSFQGMKEKRYWIIKLDRSLPPASVTVNKVNYHYASDQRAGTWSYSASDLAVHIHLPEMNVRKQITIHIKTMDNSHHLLYGYKGFVNRMKFAMQKIKFEISAVDWGAAINDSILYIESIPTRISYDPANAKKYLTEFVTLKTSLRKLIMDIKDVNPANLKKIADFLELPE